MGGVGVGMPFFTKNLVFTPTGTEGVLKFENTSAGDHTLLLDNVRIVPGVASAPPRLNAHLATGNSFQIAWPVGATQFKLQATSDLTANWSDVTTQIVVEGAQNVVTEQIDSGNRFYRLIQTP